MTPVSDQGRLGARSCVQHVGMLPRLQSRSVPMSVRGADKLPDWELPADSGAHYAKRAEAGCARLCKVMLVHLERHRALVPHLHVQANEQVVQLNKITWSIMAQHINFTLARFGKSEEGL